MKCSSPLADDSAFAREFIAGKDAVTLATDSLALDQDAFSAAFRKSPMKRAELAGLQRNAAVVLENGLQEQAREADEVPEPANARSSALSAASDL